MFVREILAAVMPFGRFSISGYRNLPHKYKHLLRNVMDDDRDLLEELAEVIAQGPIIFTPDEEFIKKINDKKED